MVDKYFRRQTKGISQRQRKYRNSWESHLSKTADLSSKILTPCLAKDKSLTILGSGKLLDFPIDLYHEYKDQITLVDRSQHALKAFNKNTVVYDITGQLDSWCHYLDSIETKNFEELLRYLKNITETLPIISSPCFRDEVLLSLNILSQLSVYWQDSVLDIFKKKFSNQMLLDKELEIINALIPSSQHLARTHINSLVPKGRHKTSLLFTDTHYIEYLVNSSMIVNDDLFFLKNERCPTQDLNLNFHKPQHKPHMEVMNALHGISIEDEIGSRCKIELLDQWLWDIVPIHSEKKNAGTKHRVIALKLSS